MQGAIRREGAALYLEETGPEHTTTRIQLKKVLHSAETEYQRIEVADSYDFGRLLVLDGCVNVAGLDETHYHEMIAHVPALMHPDPRSALVIGGGDGGTVRELLRHESIRNIDIVEIDKEVVSVCKKFFPEMASAFNDPRVHLYHDDGAAFVRNAGTREYSVILIDSSDPPGPAEKLFTRRFYESCREILDNDGIIVAQSESPYIYPAVLKEVYTLFGGLFHYVYPYRSMIPSYPSGQIYFMLGGKGSASEHFTDRERVTRFFRTTARSLSYLNPSVLSSVFSIPEDCRKLLDIG